MLQKECGKILKMKIIKILLYVGMDCKRSGTEQERVMLMMKMIAETQKVGL